MKYFIIPIIIAIALLGCFTTSETLIFKTLKFVNKQYLSDYAIDLDKVKFNWINKSLSKKNIKIKSDDICIHIMQHKNCFQEFHIDVDINLLSPSSLTINKTIIAAKSIEITTTKSEAPVSEIRIGSYLELIRNTLKEVSVKYLKIDLNKVLTHSDNVTNYASLKINNLDKENHLKGTLTYSAEEKLTSNTEISIMLIETPKIHIVSKLEQEKTKIDFELDTIFNEKKFELSLKKLNIKTLDNYNVDEGHCESIFLYYENIEINCSDIALTTKIKKQLHFNLQAKAAIKNTININQKKEFSNIRIEGGTKKNSSYDLSLDSEIKLSGSDNGVLVDLSKLNLNIFISKFSVFANELERTSFAVPVPFNNLKGSAKLKIGLDSNLDFYNFPIEGQFDLDKSKDIKLSARIDTLISLDKNYRPRKFSGEVVLEQLKLFIPDIDPLFGIPKVSGSNDIAKEIDFTPKTESDVEIDLIIKTKNINSIKVYNQFFAPYLSFFSYDKNQK